MLGVQALRHRADPEAAATLILSEAVEATRRLLEADHVTVLDVLADAELQVPASSPVIGEHTEVPSGSRSFAGYVALARKVVVVANAGHDPRFEPGPIGPDFYTGSAIGAPIFGPGGVRGVLTAESSTPNRFDHGLDHFLQGIANIIGIALLI